MANPVVIVLSLLCCFPIGLLLVWKHPHWSKKTKWTWTGAYIALFLLIAINSPPPKEATSDDKPNQGKESSSRVNTSSEAYKYGYKCGYEHGVMHARNFSVTYGSPGDGVYSDWEIDQDLELYDQPYLKDGPYNLKEPARTEWIQGFKDGERKGLGGYYKKPSR